MTDSMTRSIEVSAAATTGTVRAPPSKSETHRALLLAAQSQVPCTVSRPLMCDDTRATLTALHEFGARLHLAHDEAAAQFMPANLHAPRAVVDCRNSGTTLRLLAATAARFGQPVSFTGDESLRRRSSAGLLQLLTGLGVRCASRAGCAPITVQGPLRSGAVTVAPGSSSQFTSALLLSLPFTPGPSVVDVAPRLASAPYLDVTLAVARQAGLTIDEESSPGRRFRIHGSQQVHAASLAVAGDWSSAAFLFVGAAVSGGEVTVTGLDSASSQGDRAVLEHLARFGAKVEPRADGARVQAQPLASPGAIDLSATPDLFPALAVLAACATGTTTFRGCVNLRAKESDRIAAVADGLSRLGATVREVPDGLVVDGAPGRSPGSPYPLRGATIASHGDHRIHMAFAVAGLAASGVTRIDGGELAAVSYPDFHRDLQAIAGSVTHLHGVRQVVDA